MFFHKIVILRVCAFSIFSCFLHANRMFFNPKESCHLSEAPAQICRITNGLWRGVEEPCPQRRRGNLDDVGWQMLFGVFQPQTSSKLKRSQALRLRASRAVSRDKSLSRS